MSRLLWFALGSIGTLIAGCVAGSLLSDEEEKGEGLELDLDAELKPENVVPHTDDVLEKEPVPPATGDFMTPLGGDA